MALPEPKPGLVIGYAYLWQEEARAGQTEGRKDRPCVIVIAVQNRNGQRIVTVAPVTHSPPRNPDDAVELPAVTKQRLGLDGSRSWIVSTEANSFAWPGSDLRPISRDKPTTFAYGYIPGSVLTALRIQIVRRARISTVPRDD